MKIRFKSFLFFAILFCSAAGVFFSCSKDDEEISLKEDLKKAQEDKKILIRYWDFTRNRDASLWEKNALKAFEASHPQCRIRYTRISWIEGNTKIQLAANSGAPPDVVGSGFMSHLVKGDLLETIDEEFKDELSDFHPSALSPFYYKGKHYAVPWYITAYVLCLNLDLFNKYNVEPPENGIWTQDEFIEKMKAITFYPDGKPTGVHGMNFNINEAHYESWGFLYVNGAKILSDDGSRCLLNSPETEFAIQSLIDLEQKLKIGYSARGSIRQEESWKNFLYNRKSAVSPQGIWAVSSLRAYNKSLKTGAIKDNPRYEYMRENGLLNPIDFQIALFPTGKLGKPILTSAGVGNFIIFKQKSDEKKKLCFELVKFLTNAENQKIFSKAQSQFPARISAGNIYADDPVLSRIEPYISEAISHPCHPAWNRIDGIVQKYIQLSLMGEMTVKESVAEAEKEINRVLRKYN